MKFTCLKENLVKSLGIVSKAVPIKHSMPVLSNVLIVSKDGRLQIAGTDLDTTITSFVGASIEEEGSVTVPARILSEFISNLSSDQVVISMENDIVHITAGKTKSKINGINSVDYPTLPEVTTSNPLFEISPKEFAEAVSQVGFAVSNDSSRPIFTGIYLNYNEGNLYIAASDGFRLSERILNIESQAESFSLILPAKTLLETARIFSSCGENIKVYLNENENLCIFECEDTVIATRVIDGMYPDYKRIIPSQTSVQAAFMSQDLFEAVKLTHVFSKKDENNTLKLIISPEGYIRVTSSAQETGENHTEFSAEVLGEMEKELEIMFNARFLLDFLSNNKFEKLIFHANDNVTPCLIKPAENTVFLHVMAPMHINN